MGTKSGGVFFFLFYREGHQGVLVEGMGGWWVVSIPGGRSGFSTGLRALCW